MRLIRLYILLSILVIVYACTPTSASFTSGGSFFYQNGQYAITMVRVEYDGPLESSSVNQLKLIIPQKSITANQSGFSGKGYFLNLMLLSDSTNLKWGEYGVDPTLQTFSILPDSSNMVYYSSGDTTYSKITGGYVNLEKSIHGDHYRIALITENGDSVTGYYTGERTYNYNVDGDSVGYITINDTTVYALQNGELSYWGNFFNNDIPYFEMYLYSTNLRHKDNGDIYKGFTLTVGLQGDNDSLLANGTYPITNLYKSQTALYGHKINSSQWGSYWQTFYTGSVKNLNNILSDSIIIDDTITIHLKDQMRYQLKGKFWGHLKYVDLTDSLYKNP